MKLTIEDDKGRSYVMDVENWTMDLNVERYYMIDGDRRMDVRLSFTARQVDVVDGVAPHQTPGLTEQKRLCCD